jgi:hypothetical protein
VSRDRSSHRVEPRQRGCRGQEDWRQHAVRIALRYTIYIIHYVYKAILLLGSHSVSVLPSAMMLLFITNLYYIDMSAAATEALAIMVSEKRKRAHERKQIMRLPHSRWHSRSSTFARAVMICPSKIHPNFACLSWSSSRHQYVTGLVGQVLPQRIERTGVNAFLAFP